MLEASSARMNTVPSLLNPAFRGCSREVRAFDLSRQLPGYHRRHTAVGYRPTFLFLNSRAAQPYSLLMRQP